MTKTIITKYAIICDLDGCISDDSWRLDKIDESIPVGDSRRFEKYHSFIWKDRPISFGIDCLISTFIAQSSVSAGLPVTVHFCTARPERYRAMTLDWLCKHIGYKPVLLTMQLHMRQSEGVPTVELKRSMLTAIRTALGFHVVRAFDDREDVVNMYIEEGVQGIVLCASSGKEAPLPRILDSSPESEANSTANLDQGDAADGCGASIIRDPAHEVVAMLFAGSGCISNVSAQNLAALQILTEVSHCLIKFAASDMKDCQPIRHAMTALATLDIVINNYKEA